ncbi:hypothetical protein TESG_02312 [Trichophyton tonsurans CBS 112818]|uniref:Uncharacterized protein n=1 Tax=Trichophyton tonsurans (strain CBS 112818) TaxID=647933 RepID=F2RU09_TRIT1|nr:hypothetical protein TESG_02312 [Trichophyton tonsurans CBS 112818]
MAPATAELNSLSLSELTFFPQPHFCRRPVPRRRLSSSELPLRQPFYLLLQEPGRTHARPLVLLIEILVALASLQATTLFDHFSSFSSHTQMLSGLKTGVQTKTQLETLLCRKQDPELALVRLPQPSIRNVQQPETTAHLPTRLAFYHYSQLPQGH